MLRVGITGGIGSGKSTCAKIFQLLGIPVYDSDARAKHLMRHSLALKSSITKLFGSAAYEENGVLNRAFISSQVFSNKNLLQKLNALVHPAVHTDGQNWFTKKTKLGLSPYALKEAALIYEVAADKHLDAVIVVTAPQELRVERVVKRSKISAEAVRKRIAAQMPEEEKVKAADYVIHNFEPHSLIEQILAIHTILSEKAAPSFITK